MLKVEKLDNLYHLVQVPLAKLCHLMQTTGFKVDPSRIVEVRKRIEREMHTEEAYLTEELQTYDKPINKRQLAPPGTKSEKTGRPLKYVMVPSTKKVVPWRSAKPVEKYLYYTLHLPVQYHVKTERVTTDKMAIDKLYRLVRRDKARSDEEARSILAIKKLRRMDEILTTFCKEQMTHVKRMHPHLNVHGTANGRLSSSKPNLQNIPPAARVIYVPSQEDWVIIEADFSGIENKLAAHFAGDTERLTRFLKDKNFSEHKYAASLFFDIPMSEVEKDNASDSPYGKAKHIVHGADGGVGAQKISRMYDLDFKEVKQLLAQWKSEIAPTIRWQEVCANEAKYKGFLTNPFSRKRWFWTTAVYTESLRFLPQSSGADILYRALIAMMYERIGWPVEKVSQIVRVWEPLPQPARLLLTVHDSATFEAPRSQVDDVVGVIRRVMEQPWPELGGMNIPIGVAVGPSWGEVEKYEA
jgi:DNA polymerase-1